MANQESNFTRIKSESKKISNKSPCQIQKSDKKIQPNLKKTNTLHINIEGLSNNFTISLNTDQKNKISLSSSTKANSGINSKFEFKKIFKETPESEKIKKLVIQDSFKNHKNKNPSQVIKNINPKTLNPSASEYMKMGSKAIQTKIEGTNKLIDDLLKKDSSTPRISKINTTRTIAIKDSYTQEIKPKLLNK